MWNWFACAAVSRIEIEHHDENSFHTTYKVERYTKYAKDVEAMMNVHLTNENISHRICLASDPSIPSHASRNPGPPKGFAPFWNCRGWFTSIKGEKVRYPRLGSFEVTVLLSSGFAPPTSGLPDRLQVWSKLSSQRWPNPDTLAQKVARILAAGRDSDDVSGEVKQMHQRWTSTARSEKPKPIPHPPMFFGLTPRGGTPTPVERRTPGGDNQDSMSRSCSPPRPVSAFSTYGSTTIGASTASPPRPSSAQQLRSPSSGPAATTQALSL
eukprot:s2262_g8.t1